MEAKARLTTLRVWLRSGLIAACAALGVAAPVSAQKRFEGTITYEVTGPGMQTQMVVSARGKKLRQEIHRADEPEASRGNFVIIDYDRGAVTPVFPAMKSYVVFSFNRIRAMIAARDSARDDETRALFGDVVATGRRENVAGLGCDVYAFKNLPDEEWCVTTQLGSLLGFGDNAATRAKDGGLTLPQNDATVALLHHFENGALILRMRISQRSGQLVSTIATKVDRSPPPERRFAIPGGYAEMDNAIFARP